MSINIGKDINDSIYYMIKVMENRCVYTTGHSNRVAEYSQLIAEQMDLSYQTIRRIYAGALLHDIGKIGIPDYILNKPGKLTESEYNLIRKHPQIGFNILSGIKEMKPILPIVLMHHERIDGTGYPLGYSRDLIPIEARIVVVADSFDAMLSMRPYRDKQTLDYAIKELTRHANTQFDGEVVKAFIKVIKNFLKHNKRP